MAAQSSGIVRPKFSRVIAGVEGVDRCEFVGGEVEVEDVEVFCDPLWFGQFGDHRMAVGSFRLAAIHVLGAKTWPGDETGIASPHQGFVGGASAERQVSD
jgi:hypothetical protein